MIAVVCVGWRTPNKSARTINRFHSQETTAHLLVEAFVLFRRQLIINQVIDNEATFMDGTKNEK